MKRTAKGSGAAPDNEQWYYMAGEQKCGPVDTAEIQAMLSSGELAPDTRVWSKSLGKWSPANTTDLVNHMNNGQITVEQEAEKPSKRKKWWIWLIVGILIAILVGVACAVLVSRKKNAAAPEETAEPVVTEPVITYGIEEPLVYEDDQCAFWIDTVYVRGDYLELDVRCQNKIEDVLRFAWDGTSINGSMFDPQWEVYVQGNATLDSSITFPFTNLDSHNLMPGDEIKYVLSVFNMVQYEKVLEESGDYIYRNANPTGKDPLGGSKEIEGYEGWFFSKKVRVDKDGRPYYVAKDKSKVYFDTIRDPYGSMVYEPDRTTIEKLASIFYKDIFGRPYYFNKAGSTVYYDGYGYAFYDAEADRNYYYDINGQISYFGNNGVPEYYEGTVTQEQLDAGKPEKLEKAEGHFIVLKEFSLYPTGKTADQITRPERIYGENEKVYWDGEKGCFVLLDGTKNVQGYVIHTYVENNTDQYFYFCWTDVTVNGFNATLDSSTPMRPHSYYYRDILVTAETLQEIEEKLDSDALEEIGFRLYALGENLNVPLYPITWDVPAEAENEE